LVGKWTRGIALYEIVGGALGALFMGLGGLHASVGEIAVLATVLPFVLLIAAGTELWRKRPVGYILSFVLQCTQVVSISVASFIWRFTAGASVVIGYSVHRLNAWAALDLTFLAGVTRGEVPLVVGINLVSLGLAGMLLKALRSKRAQREGASTKSDPTKSLYV
jgi:hypothetical protein